jgi:hypothetical protein
LQIAHAPDSALCRLAHASRAAAVFTAVYAAVDGCHIGPGRPPFASGWSRRATSWYALRMASSVSVGFTNRTA